MTTIPEKTDHAAIPPASSPPGADQIFLIDAFRRLDAEALAKALTFAQPVFDIVPPAAALREFIVILDQAVTSGSFVSNWSSSLSQPAVERWLTDRRLGAEGKLVFALGERAFAFQRQEAINGLIAGCIDQARRCVQDHVRQRAARVEAANVLAIPSCSWTAPTAECVTEVRLDRPLDEPSTDGLLAKLVAHGIRFADEDIAILVGSVASMNNNSRSDIDICIITERDSRSIIDVHFQPLNGFIGHCAAIGDSPKIDLFVYPRRQLTDAIGAFVTSRTQFDHGSLFDGCETYVGFRHLCRLIGGLALTNSVVFRELFSAPSVAGILRNFARYLLQTGRTMLFDAETRSSQGDWRAALVASREAVLWVSWSALVARGMAIDRRKRVSERVDKLPVGDHLAELFDLATINNPGASVPLELAINMTCARAICVLAMQAADGKPGTCVDGGGSYTDLFACAHV
jgi:hypothetical protein